MATLVEIERQVETLPPEDRKALLDYLLGMPGDTPPGAGDEEVAARERAMDAGEVQPVNYETFVAIVRGQVP